MTSFLVADDACRGHLVGRTHPEKPERYDAIMDKLARDGLLDRMRRAEVRTATDDELLLCHTAEYLKTARNDVESGRHYLSTGDTDITPDSWDVAARAAGGVLNAVDAVLTGTARNAFCAVRPPVIMRMPDGAWDSACSTTSPSARGTCSIASGSDGC